MPATWLADVLRAGGCKVDETIVPDWKRRGHTDGATMDQVVGVMGHHTAGPRTGDLPSLRTVRDGRPGLDGPLANLMLSRCGVWVPIAAGRPWHAGNADSPAAWPWIPNGDANGHVLGIEAESAGDGDWTPEQLDAYPRGVAALLAHLGADHDRFLGHLEWAPTRKIDPAGWPGGMNGFRATVAANANGDDMFGPDDSKTLDAIYQVIMRQRPGGVQDNLNVGKAVLAQVKGLQVTVTATQAAVAALAAAKGADPAEIKQVVSDAVEAALKDLTITLSADGGDTPSS